MIYIFIIIVLYLLIYQIYHIIQIEEGLDNNQTTTNTASTSSQKNTNTLPNITTPGNNGSTTDLCKNNNSYSTLSLTDKNLLFLNDRINILNNNYLDLSMNVIKLNNQLKESALNSANDATNLVGNKPIEVS